MTDESDHLLTRHENKKTSALLDAEHVNWLVETKLGALMDRNDAVDEMQAAEEKEKWNEVTTRVKGELAGMVENDAKEEAATNENNELEQFLLSIRAKVVAENNVSSTIP